MEADKRMTIEQFEACIRQIEGDRYRLQGCTDAEIEKMKKAQNVASLPLIYVEFMKRYGKLEGRFLAGTDLHYEDTLEYKDVVYEMPEEDMAIWILPENKDLFFVFWSHHSYKFYYFYIEDGEDPPIYMVIDVEKEEVKMFDSFSRLLYRWCLAYEDRIKKRGLDYFIR